MSEPTLPNPAPTPPAPIPTPPAVPPGYISQADADRIAGQARADGARKWLREQTGVEKLDDLKALIEKAKKADADAMTEAERARAEATTARAEADADRAAVARERLALKLERAAIAAGATASTSVAALLTAEEGVTPETVDADVTAAVERLRARIPGLFGPATPPAPGAQPQTAPGSVPGRPPAAPPQPPAQFGAAGMDEAKRRGYVKVTP